MPRSRRTFVDYGRSVRAPQEMEPAQLPADAIADLNRLMLEYQDRLMREAFAVPLAHPTAQSLNEETLAQALLEIRQREQIDHAIYAGFQPRSFGNPPSSEAETRARTLLLRLLTPEQRKDYENTGGFNVVRGGKRYRLARKTLQVYVSGPSGAIEESWCANIPNEPREDTLVAQLLLLRSDPDKLRAMSNVSVWPLNYRNWAFANPDNPLAQNPGDSRRAQVHRILSRAGYVARNDEP